MLQTLPAPAGPSGPPDPAALFSNIECAVVGARRMEAGADGSLARRSVPHYSLFICIAGAADFTVDGRPYRVEEGSLLLAPPLAPHAATHTGAFAYFLIEFIALAFGVLDVAAVCGLPVLLTPGASRRPKFPASAVSITHQFANHPPGYALVLHTHCVRLLSLMWSETLAQTNAPTDRPAQLNRIFPVLQAIERHYAEPLHVDYLASLVHLHPTYFCTVFKQSTGYSPLRYVAKRRFEHALALLTGTVLPLDEIASRTGFYDAAHLIRVFRKEKGVSPGRYRRSGLFSTARSEARPISH